MAQRGLSWFGILRLGLVQACMGGVVVLTTSTLNRVMVVELALPALVPGALVALHYLMQFARPRMGYGSDVGQRRTPWIIAGMATLAAGGLLAAVATAWMATHRVAGIALAVLAFALIGGGVSACGTSLLVLLAKRVDAARRPSAASIVWMMMIAGFAVTAGVAGRMLDPYSGERLVGVSAAVSAVALLLTLCAMFRLEGPPAVAGDATTRRAPPPFREAMAQAWADRDVRHFTVFVFVSMLAYSAQDLILEPFAGAVFGLTPGQTTQLSAAQHGGVLVGMIIVAVAGAVMGRRSDLRAWVVAGCGGSALALSALALSAFAGRGWPLRETIFLLGVANGVFAVAAIGAMMQRASQGEPDREGVRMGLWGAAQAVAFALGGLAGTLASDVAHAVLTSGASAYAAVFALEAVGFLAAAYLSAPLASAARADAGKPAPLQRVAAAHIQGGPDANAI
ncbi:MAG: BCD family MFS transporter [Betaproteobacteria bacterium]|nr:BCD family MFS transporter [Betaproteobacteria bacterium]